MSSTIETVYKIYKSSEITMPSGTGNPTKDPPTGRRQTRRNSKRAVQSEAVSQDTSSQITKQGPMNRRGSPRKRNQHKNLTDSGQLQTAFLVSPLTSVTHLDTTSDGPHNRPGPASERIPIRGTSSRSSTIDQHTSATPKRNHRGLRPEQDASNLTTPIDFNSTPPVQAYAGPTFHASPAPSALPIPRLFSKSVPVGGKTTNMKAMVQDPSVETPSNKSDDSPTMRNAIQVNEGPVSEASPLDIFFNADRAEKARRTAAIAASSPLTRSPAYPVDIPQSVSPIPEYMRNHSRQNTGGSIGGGMFPLEMDASEKAASRHIPRPPLWESNRSELSPSRLSPEQAKAKTEAMKEILRISQTKENMPFVFSPAMPIPLHFDVGRRIVELEGYLNPEDPRYQPPEQHLNIRKVIDLYKTGTIAGGEQVCVCHGRIIPLEDLFRIKDWKWLEVCRPLLGKSMTNKFLIGIVSSACVQTGLWSFCWRECR